MDSLTLSILLATFSGLAIPLGGFLSTITKFQKKWREEELRHFIIAFGGGALFAAVALILVPDGIARLGTVAACIAFTSGGIAFFALDRLISRKGGAYAQLLAMLLDYIPEAIALGAALAMGEPAAFLLAMLIALQNLPEGFNAHREISAAGQFSSRAILLAFCFLPLLGAVSGWMGHNYAADYPAFLGALMLFAASGIIYLTFEDIAPAVKLEKSWLPPLGAVAGFQIGLLGHLLLG